MISSEEAVHKFIKIKRYVSVYITLWFGICSVKTKFHYAIQVADLVTDL